MLSLMKLDLFDVRNVLCEIPQKDKNAFDANLYVNFSEDKLFEKANKVAKIMPNFFKEMGVTRKPFQRTSDNIQGSRLLVTFLSGDDFTKILYPQNNSKVKDFIGTKYGKLLTKFIQEIYMNNDGQNDYEIVTKKYVKELKIKPENIRVIVEKILDDNSSRIGKIKKYFDSHPKSMSLNSTHQSSSTMTDDTSEDNGKLENVQKLTEYVIGQDEACEVIRDKILGTAVGFRSEKQPLATFLLTGPTGVGKTETAKAIADLCFDGNFFTVDMTTFKSDADISRLVGASPNYVGYGDANAFCDFLAEHPKSVLLFDEIEKAHAGCLDILMHMLDEGQFITSRGNVISLKDTVVFCTTNLTEYIEDDKMDYIEKMTSKQGLRKEIVGRFNEVVEYKHLNKEACKEIAQKFFLTRQIEHFNTNNQGTELKIEYTDDLLDKIISDANYKLFGARDIKKAIQKDFISPAANYIIKNRPQNTTIVVSSNGVNIKKENSQNEDKDSQRMA